MVVVAPVEPLIVISPFGPRPRLKADGTPGPLHPGLDLACHLGQDVRAVAAGVVLKSYLSACDPPTWRPGDPAPRVMGYGHNILVSHSDGTTSRYCHLLSRSVEAGDHVEAGQVVGKAGSTGYSTGVHLHYERRRGGVPFDPAPEFAHILHPSPKP